MSETIEVKVPDIGDYKDVPVIEVFVKPGDSVKAEESLITVESDKATMEVPSPAPGIVKELKVKVGDKVSKGSLVLMLEAADAASIPAGEKAAAPQAAAAQPAPAREATAPAKTPTAPPQAAPPRPAEPARPAAPAAPVDEAAFGKAHASPSIRRFARELGVDLSKVNGSGPKGRILKEDVQGFVKSELARPRGAEAPGGGLGLNLPPLAPVDFSKFGAVETRPLSR